jgi:hypothetical protein
VRKRYMKYLRPMLMVSIIGIAAVCVGQQAAGKAGTIRTGAKVPFTVLGKNGDREITYIDVGVSFDIVHLRIVNGNRVSMTLKAEISSLDRATVSAENNPTIRQNRWGGDVQIPLGEHKVIFSSDDLASKRTMQIEMTVTRAY